MAYKKANEIFDPWPNDKQYDMGLIDPDGFYDIRVIFAKDINEARRLSGFWLSDSGLRQQGYKVKYVLPSR